MTANTTAPAFPELAAFEAAYTAAVEKLEALNHRRSEAQRTLEESRDSLAAFEKERKQLLKRQALGGSTPETAAALARINADHAAAEAAIKEAETFLDIFPEVEIKLLITLQNACGNYNGLIRQIASEELQKAQKKLFEAMRPIVAAIRMWKAIVDHDRTPSASVRTELSRLLALDQIPPSPSPFTFLNMSISDSARIDRWKEAENKAKAAQTAKLRAKAAGCHSMRNPSEEELNALYSRRQDESG